MNRLIDSVTVALRKSRSPKTWVYAFSCGYFIVLLVLLPRLSLWLDEIHELQGVRFLSFAQLPAYSANDGGGVPLGFLTQFMFVKAFGFSAVTGRLASAISSALACLALGITCRQVRFRFPLLAMAIFAFLPLQLRYAAEARPYAQALCFTVLCTLTFMLLIKDISPWRCVFYLGTVIAGLYTQPFSFFVPLGQWVWLAVSTTTPERKKLLPIMSSIVAVAALAFVPWYTYAHQFWRASVDAGNFRFVFGWKELSLLAHELIGAGYFGTAIVLFLSIYGLLASQLDAVQKRLWATLLVVPLAGPILADAFFGYFLAIRQFIFLMPSLAFTSAIGIEALLARKRSVLGSSILIVLAAALITGDVRWFTKPRENWGQQSAVLKKQLSIGGCVMFIPAGSESYFSFFNPDLKALQCSSSSLPKSVWLAISPYDAEAEYRMRVKQLDSLGFTSRPFSTAERPRLERFERGTFIGADP